MEVILVDLVAIRYGCVRVFKQNNVNDRLTIIRERSFTKTPVLCQSRIAIYKPR